MERAPVNNRACPFVAIVRVHRPRRPNTRTMARLGAIVVVLDRNTPCAGCCATNRSAHVEAHARPREAVRRALFGVRETPVHGARAIGLQSPDEALAVPAVGVGGWLLPPIIRSKHTSTLEPAATAKGDGLQYEITHSDRARPWRPAGLQRESSR